MLFCFYRKGYRTQKEDPILRRYETIFITPPDLPEADQAQLLEKIQSILTGLKGDIVKLEDWGIKKLSYDIRKNSRGHYYLLDYLSESQAIRELERALRLNDRILKYQTVKISDRLSAEAIQALKESSPAQKVVLVSEPAAIAEEREGEEHKRLPGGEGETK